jgi:hypothetical protein
MKGGREAGGRKGGKDEWMEHCRGLKLFLSLNVTDGLSFVCGTPEHLIPGHPTMPSWGTANMMPSIARTKEIRRLSLEHL